MINYASGKLGLTNQAAKIQPFFWMSGSAQRRGRCVTSHLASSLKFQTMDKNIQSPHLLRLQTQA